MGYDSGYESSLIRGIQEPKPWNLIEEIRKRAKKSHVLLDIGCGTAFKLIKLTKDVNKIYGLEPNQKMLEKAKENIRKAGLTNIVLVKSFAEKLPFEDNTFNIVTCMVAPHNTLEVYRVLKQGGFAILEKIGDRDKWNLQQEFGNDEKGPRGQFHEFKEGERAEMYRQEFEKLFLEVSIQNGFWKTYYSIEGLILLLEQTPLIKGFDKEKDKDALEQIQKKYMTEKGVETQQNRFLIIARK